MIKKVQVLLAVVLSVALIAGCGADAAETETGSVVSDPAETNDVSEESEVSAGEDEAGAEDLSTDADFSADQSADSVETGLEKLDMTAWNYEADNDFYWQTGISYCENPADIGYETMGFFIPGAYFDADDNGDGTYTCTINKTAKAGDYTADEAPMVIPVNTPGYAAMSAPEDNSSSCGYGSVSDYTGAGFVLVFAGARGRDAGAPAGVTDFKAAIRYARYNADILPGDPDRFFSFGMSGGGAQSALIGTTGDSALYTPYLNAIGAVSGISDAVTGSMCWCPITNLDVADAAYEWNMGTARTGIDDETQKLSDGLAGEFAAYINKIGLTDETGKVLVLEETEDGLWQAGSYYDYIRSVVEHSLNNFLADTEFPYDSDSASSGGPGGGMGGFGGFGGGPGGDFNGEMPDGDFEGGKPEGMDGEMPGGMRGGMRGGPGNDKGDGGGETSEGTDYAAIDDINRNDTNSGVSISGTYDTAQDYIDALNADGEWVSYDAAENTASITSIADFVAAMKAPSKDVGAFDALDRSQGENTLFGYNDGNGAHFDAIEAKLLKGTDYESEFSADLAKEDALGNTVDYRVNMYNPMYYLCDHYEGKGSSEVAKYFRIRTGICQGDTALCTEADLALALSAYGCDVDFETVWGLGHTEAERTGDSTESFIAWVNKCVDRT